jgi:diguanylate cyclase (GGDEF)-like protein
MGSPAGTRGRRLAPLLAVVAAIGLLSVAVAAAASEHSRERDALDRTLRGEAAEHAQKLEHYFQRARSLTLVTANNPAYAGFYADPRPRVEKIVSGDQTVREAQRGLAYLENLFPGEIGEACFIDASGAENARAVRGRVESYRNLSPDETKAPFYKPTFALKAGQVYQARPYISPDTHEWVVSNSTPIPTADGSKPAILHFEVTVESFRKQAADTGDRFDISIVEANGGHVIADSRHPQKAGDNSKLGLPGDDRFVRFVSAAGRGAPDGTMTVDGRPSAFHTLEKTPNNANTWVVVATARTPASTWVQDLGVPELAMIALALLLLGFGVFSVRASHARLEDAAMNDPLTGLGNRRKLIADLDSALRRASEERPLLLALFDLNGFKSYNDSFGHLAGDALLTRLAASLRSAVGDRAYRMGGDEFCLLARVGPAVGEELLAAASEALTEHGEGFGVDASYGAVLLPADASDASNALRLADQRMYSMKSGGRTPAGRQTTDALVKVLAERHPEIGVHLDDVADLVRRVALVLDLPDEEREPLTQAAALHDVGKAAVPDDILEKPGPLTAEEWVFMRQHTIVGERILMAAPSLSAAARLVRWSHERFDGSGYPDGLRGEQIPRGARIIAVCDAFDAMTTPRPYRTTPLSVEAALAELRAGAGTQFDPTVVAAFARALTEEHESVQAS